MSRVYEWDVTLVAKGTEVTVRVKAPTKTIAEAEARRWHPGGFTLRVEQVPGSGRIA